jgi:glycosyltransferase involved in cell wall biosynthesis
LLTDHVGNGDGLIAHGFIDGLARRGHALHVAYESADLDRPFPQSVRLHRIPLVARGEMPRRLEYMARVRLLYERLRRSFAFDLIHQMNPVFTPLSLALARCGTPIVLGSYVPHWPGTRGSITAPAYAALSRMQQSAAAALLVTTPAALERIDPAPSIRAKVRYLDHAVDARLLEQADAHGPESAPEVLFVGSIAERKGVFDLLRAFERVLVELPTARLRLVGEGEASARVQHEVANLGAGAEQIVLHGPVKRASVPELLARCDVFCLPSHGEPYGMAVLEAMAGGKPVVTTDTGGLPYLVSADGGICVPQGDVEKLSAALLRILRSSELRRSMGAHNRAVVESRFTWGHILEKLELVYEEALR